MQPWLLVEDEPDIREMLLAVFEIWNIQCIVHQSSEETLAWLNTVEHLAETELPELALIDIRLSGDTDGITVSQHIRHHPKLKNIAIVLNTAYSLTEQEKQQCLAVSKADHVMSKPLPRFERLYEELRTLIQKKAASIPQKQQIEEQSYPPITAPATAPDLPARPQFRVLRSLRIRPFRMGRGLSREAKKLLQVASLAILGGSFVLLVGLALSVIPLIGREGSFAELYHILQQALILAGLLSAVCGLWFLLRANQRRKTDDLLAQEVFQTLARNLDARFSFISSSQIRSVCGIDALMIGPPGLLIFKFLHLNGQLYQERGHWLTQNRKGELIPLKNNPTQELLSDMNHIQQRLDGQGLSDFPIFGAILSLNDSDQLQYHANEEIFPLVFAPSLNERLKQSYFFRDRITLRAAGKLLEHLRQTDRHP
ncbi:MAG: response regulator [Anaerolineaceae bacterium]|nr:response regulator [Anaerolineaceae bacterium]